VIGSSQKDIGLKVLVECMSLSLLNLNVQFFHVYRYKNSAADEMANHVIGKAHRLMEVNGIEQMVSPPLVIT
jgi:hypothetical protein